MYERVLAGYEKALEPDHVSTLDTVNNLGVVHFNQSKHDEAEKMHKRALDGFEKVLAPDYRSTLVTVSNLGRLYRLQGRPDDAERLYKRVHAWNEKQLDLYDDGDGMSLSLLQLVLI